MAATLSYFLLPEDELALFRQLEPHGLTLYPELIEADYQPFAADASAPAKLELDAYYLLAERFGDLVVHTVKRGPDKGRLKIDEIGSPCFHYERSLMNEKGELVAGRLWSELDITDDMYSLEGKPRGLRKIFDELHNYFRKTHRRSEPKGYWVGAKAAAAVKGGLVLREPGHRGGVFGVWR